MVTGYEAMCDTFEVERGRRVINRFAIGIDRGLIAKELAIHNLNYLVRLLLIRDYRAALVQPGHFAETITETNVTTHVKLFYLYGYDL